MTITRLQEYASRKKLKPGNTETYYIPAYLHLSKDANKEYLRQRYGIILNVEYNDIYTAMIPIQAMKELSEEHSVISIDVGNEMRTQMDSVRLLSYINEAYMGTGLPHAYQGEGVIIGIIDSGFDFTHPNFRDINGNCRIKYVWDQNQIFMASNSTYGYGVVYQNSEEVLGAKHDMSGDTHGTHVAGIATGGYENIYRGVAPKADIAIVSTNRSEQGIIDGIDFLLKYSEEQNKPMVINLSMGAVTGYKDGTNNFSVMTDNLMKDKKGKLLVIAAGNEGHRNSTIKGSFNSTNTEVKSFLTPPSYNRDGLFIQCDAGHTYTLEISLKDIKKNKTIFCESFISGEKWSKSYENFGTGEDNDAIMNISSENNPLTGCPSFSVFISYTKPETEEWEIKLSSPDGGNYMICSDYGHFSSKGTPKYADGTSDMTIACTATGKESISTGAYISKESYIDILGNKHNSGWQRLMLYPLSGKGPTFDGRIKPDITAPGATVISSFNSYAASYSVKTEEKVYETTDISGRKFSWGVANGTSMATPVVTGTLALWLEANPTLTKEEAYAIMKKTSEADIHTGQLPNNMYGMGKINTTSGLKEILKQSSGITDIMRKADFFYDRNSETVRILSDTQLQRLEIYSSSGYMTDIIKNPADNTFSISKYPKGLYLVKAYSKSKLQTFKIIR